MYPGYLIKVRDFFKKLGQSRPLLVYFRLFHVKQFKYKLIKAQIMYLGLKPRATGWMVQTNPLNYCGTIIQVRDCLTNFLIGNIMLIVKSSLLECLTFQNAFVSLTGWTTLNLTSRGFKSQTGGTTKLAWRRCSSSAAEFKRKSCFSPKSKISFGNELLQCQRLSRWRHRVDLNSPGKFYILRNKSSYCCCQQCSRMCCGKAVVK